MMMLAFRKTYIDNGVNYDYEDLVGDHDDNDVDDHDNYDIDYYFLNDDEDNYDG